MIESKPAGFESHWDWEWFKEKADKCRSFAELVVEPTAQSQMLLLADDFQKQSEHAKLLASISTANKQ